MLQYDVNIHIKNRDTPSPVEGPKACSTAFSKLNMGIGKSVAEIMRSFAMAQDVTTIINTVCVTPSPVEGPKANPTFFPRLNMGKGKSVAERCRSFAALRMTRWFYSSLSQNRLPFKTLSIILAIRSTLVSSFLAS